MVTHALYQESHRPLLSQHENIFQWTPTNLSSPRKTVRRVTYGDSAVVCRRRVESRFGQVPGNNPKNPLEIHFAPWHRVCPRPDLPWTLTLAPWRPNPSRSQVRQAEIKGLPVEEVSVAGFLEFVFGLRSHVPEETSPSKEIPPGNRFTCVMTFLAVGEE